MLLVVNMPPPLRSEPDGIDPVLVVPSKRIVVAEPMRNTKMVVRSNVPCVSSGVCCACLAQDAFVIPTCGRCEVPIALNDQQSHAHKIWLGAKFARLYHHKQFACRATATCSKMSRRIQLQVSFMNISDAMEASKSAGRQQLPIE